MAEPLDVYDLHGKFLRTQERDAFYEETRREFARTGKITRKIKSIRLLILTSSGRVYIQKRSDLKKENPGLYDKTIGGHVKRGQTLNLTVMQECHEELGIPAVVLSDKEFREAVKTTNLTIIGVMRKVGEISTFLSTRKSSAGDFKQPYINTFYIGYYDGSVRFCDGESSGIEVVPFPELQRRLREHPEVFTEDLKFMVGKYKKHIVPLAAIGKK